MLLSSTWLSCGGGASAISAGVQKREVKIVRESQHKRPTGQIQRGNGYYIGMARCRAKIRGTGASSTREALQVQGSSKKQPKERAGKRKAINGNALKGIEGLTRRVWYWAELLPGSRCRDQG
jgi:hypothetical protein